MEPFKCPHCGNSTYTFSYSCAFCGETTRTDEEWLKMQKKGTIVCNWCGFIDEDASNFCKKCGTPLTKEALESREDRETTKELYNYLKSLNNSGAKRFLSKLKHWGKEK